MITNGYGDFQLANVEALGISAFTLEAIAVWL